MGSVAFKINLLSAFSACFALVCLFMASRKLIENFYPDAGDGKILSASIPAGLLAFSLPFWVQSLAAEVYTLHALFICMVFYLLLSWKEKEDVRFLYAAALIFGLSSGNHATSAFILPSILILFFSWSEGNKWRHLSVSSLFFLVGLSIYVYLPIRSMAEPSMDWGNPETLKGFWYQVTDQKDAATHFSFLSKNDLGGRAGAEVPAWSLWWPRISRVFLVFWNLMKDLTENYSPVAALGFVAGGILCWRKSAPLFWAFLLLAAINGSFFSGWRKESYFPTYIVAALLTAVFVYWGIYQWKGPSNSAPENNSSPPRLRWRRIALAGLIGLIPLGAVQNYYAADRSRFYFGETLLKRAYLTLEDRSLFVPGISWFNFYYFNDVARLRDDVTAVKAWDLLGEDPPSLLTRKRYPDLNLPDPSNHRFDSLEGSAQYVLDLFEANRNIRPVLVEQNILLMEQLALADNLEPDRGLFVKYKGSDSAPAALLKTPDPGFLEFEALLNDELKKPGIQFDREWVNKPAYFIPSFAGFYHDKEMYDDEWNALKVMRDFLGHQGPEWSFKAVENRILGGKTAEAREQWNSVPPFLRETVFVFLAQGLLLRAEGDVPGSLAAFEKAAALDSRAFRPRLELSLSYRLLGDVTRAQAERALAERNAGSLREWKKLKSLWPEIKSELR